LHLVSITNGLVVGVVVPFGFDGYQGPRATQFVLLVDGDDAFLSLSICLMKRVPNLNMERVLDLKLLVGVENFTHHV